MDDARFCFCWVDGGPTPRRCLSTDAAHAWAVNLGDSYQLSSDWLRLLGWYNDHYILISFLTMPPIIKAHLALGENRCSYIDALA